MNPRVLPCAMIILSIGSSIGYGFASDWRRTIYWAAASVLTASVTF